MILFKIAKLRIRFSRRRLAAHHILLYFSRRPTVVVSLRRVYLPNNIIHVEKVYNVHFSYSCKLKLFLCIK